LVVKSRGGSLPQSFKISDCDHNKYQISAPDRVPLRYTPSGENNVIGFYMPYSIEYIEEESGHITVWEGSVSGDELVGSYYDQFSSV